MPADPPIWGPPPCPRCTGKGCHLCSPDEVPICPQCQDKDREIREANIAVTVNAHVRAETIALLRDLCAQTGDNDWPDDLHPADVIEKHLWRSINAEIERHQARAEAAEAAIERVKALADTYDMTRDMSGYPAGREIAAAIREALTGPGEGKS